MEIELDENGIREFLKSESMQDLLRERAEEIQRRCGDGFDVNVKVGKTRAASSVITNTTDAILENLQTNTVLKAVK